MPNNLRNKIFTNYVSTSISSIPSPEIVYSGILQKLGLTWVLNHAPCFYINSKQVKILNTPQSFYELILDQIQKANNRIVLASLYLGTGLLENNIVLALKKRMEEKPDLKVKILFDYSRGSRNQINSRKMVLPLLKDHEKSCQVSLYQTSMLQGFLIPYLPTKYKEIIGLQHLKVYLFDNNFIITGANLSNDYFTNRQDRYMFIDSCQELTDFVEGLVDRITHFSWILDKEDKVKLMDSWPFDPSQTDPKTFNFAASSWIRNYYEKYIDRINSVSDENDTVVFPLIEMGPLHIHVDSEVTSKLLENCDKKTDVHLTTGYFNLTKYYIDTIINKSKAKYNILTAHPTANGFYKAKGLAGGIPHAYTNIALQFLDKVIANNQEFRIKMLEYKRPGWTYHAKGLWLSSNDNGLPFLTMIGSPNFGERSREHDLECQFLLATVNKELQNELRQEKNYLYDSCYPFTYVTCSEPERKTPLWVHVVVWLFKSYL